MKIVQSTLSSIRDYNFRSIIEINTWIRNLKTSSIIATSALKYSVASGSITTAALINTPELQHCYKTMESLNSKIKSIDLVITQLSTRFDGIEGANSSMSHAIAVRRNLELKIEEIESFINSIAVHHFPDSHSPEINDVINMISNTIRNDGVDTKHYVVFDNQIPSFFRYVCFSSLTDTNGIKHPKYYLVFKITPSSVPRATSVYLNSEFVCPTKLPSGEQYIGSDALRRIINTSLVTDKFVSAPFL